MKFPMVPAVLFGLFLASVCPTSSVANPDGNPIGISVDYTQLIESEQTDASGPQHRASSLAIDIFSLWDEEFGPVVETAPEVVLPEGATGTIASADFVGDDTNSIYFFESGEDDAFERFPAGDYTFNFSSEDDSCLVEVDVLFLDFETFDGDQGSGRPKVRNETGWKEGRLCLPKNRLVIRWDQVGDPVFQSGDTEITNQIKITDEISREVVLQSRIGDVFENGFAVYPRLLFGDQGGLDLSGMSSIVEGKTYDVVIDKTMESIWVDGDNEVVGTVTSLVSFKLFVEPPSTTRSAQLHVSTDDEASTVSIRWTPQPDEEYIILNSAINGFIDFDLGLQTHFDEPAEPGGDHIFTDAITSDRKFYRVFSFLK